MVGRLVCYAFIENKRKQYYEEVSAGGDILSLCFCISLGCSLVCRSVYRLICLSAMKRVSHGTLVGFKSIGFR